MESEHSSELPANSDLGDSVPTSGSERVRAVDEAIAELLAELQRTREDADEDGEDGFESPARTTLPWRRHLIRPDDGPDEESPLPRVVASGERFIPPPVPSSFRRDKLGRWRHHLGGGYVSKAADVRLRDGFAFERTESTVYVPTAVVRCQPLFRFCIGYPMSIRGVWPCFEVPADLFDEYGSESVGFIAPEVALPFLVDTAGFAAFLNVSPRTVSAYLARGTLPEPVARIGSSPVWSLTQLSLWVEHRAVEGRLRTKRLRRQRRDGRG